MRSNLCFQQRYVSNLWTQPVPPTACWCGYALSRTCAMCFHSAPAAVSRADDRIASTPPSERLRRSTARRCGPFALLVVPPLAAASVEDTYKSSPISSRARTRGCWRKLQLTLKPLLGAAAKPSMNASCNPNLHQAGHHQDNGGGFGHAGDVERLIQAGGSRAGRTRQCGVARNPESRIS